MPLHSLSLKRCTRDRMILPKGGRGVKANWRWESWGYVKWVLARRRRKIRREKDLHVTWLRKIEQWKDKLDPFRSVCAKARSYMECFLLALVQQLQFVPSSKYPRGFCSCPIWCLEHTCKAATTSFLQVKKSMFRKVPDQLIHRAQHAQCLGPMKLWGAHGNAFILLKSEEYDPAWMQSYNVISNMQYFSISLYL